MVIKTGKELVNLLIQLPLPPELKHWLQSISYWPTYNIWDNMSWENQCAVMHTLGDSEGVKFLKHMKKYRLDVHSEDVDVRRNANRAYSDVRHVLESRWTLDYLESKLEYHFEKGKS